MRKKRCECVCVVFVSRLTVSFLFVSAKISAPNVYVLAVVGLRCSDIYSVHSGG